MTRRRGNPSYARVFVLVAATAIPAFAQFETRSSSPVQLSPLSTAVADFNHDGVLDIAATAEGVNGRVAILLGRGDGTFEPAVYYTVGTSADSVTAADFNHDGNVDLAVADGLDRNISVLLGNGDGTFGPPAPYPTTAYASYVAVGDFNNDRNPDLVMCDEPYVSVLLGNGDGTFGSPKDYDVSLCSQASGAVLAAGDFNRDGKLDVAAVGHELYILLGNGDGTFQLAEEYLAGIGPSSIAVGDFNRDGKLDLAVADFIGGEIEIFQGNGDGTFQSAAAIPSYFPGAILAADLNGDGNPDLVFLIPVGGSSPANLLTMMLGNGNGTFQPAINFPYGRESVFVTGGGL